MEQLFIFPFNGNGLEALDCIGDQYEFIGFIDDTSEKQGVHNFGFEVFSRDILSLYPNAKILAVPGSPISFSYRDKTIDSLNISNDRFVSIIHPKAVVSTFATIGKNVLIMAGVVITSDSILEDHVCVLPNTVIHHDSIIGAYTLLGSNVTIAGNTKIGKKCYIGSGTSVVNNIIIEDEVMVGIGSNVISPISKNKKVVGNPAKSI
jgi:sugar O-acyltransferase (sialic acid O-acetyltransferase NeuD family)